MTQVMEVTAAIRAVTVKMKFPVKRQQEDVSRDVLLAMKESTVTKVNNKSKKNKLVYMSNKH